MDTVSMMRVSICTVVALGFRQLTRLFVFVGAFRLFVISCVFAQWLRVHCRHRDAPRPKPYELPGISYEACVLYVCDVLTVRAHQKENVLRLGDPGAALGVHLRVCVPTCARFTIKRHHVTGHVWYRRCSADPVAIDSSI